MDLQDKVFITGGLNGLGLALAREFAKHKSSLVLSARSEEELRKAKQDLAAHGVEVITISGMSAAKWTG